MKKMINGREVTVKHIMKNGEVRDSLDGYEITIDDLPGSGSKDIKTDVSRR